jgi:hypothetical protein
MKKLGQKSIAFPCISTGIYGYPNEDAAEVALRTIRQWMDNLQSQHELASSVDRIIFCLFLQRDVDCYEYWMQHYFPVLTWDVPTTKGLAMEAKSPVGDKKTESPKGAAGSGNKLTSPKNAAGSDRNPESSKGHDANESKNDPRQSSAGGLGKQELSKDADASGGRKPVTQKDTADDDKKRDDVNDDMKQTSAVDAASDDSKPLSSIGHDASESKNDQKHDVADSNQTTSSRL